MSAVPAEAIAAPRARRRIPALPPSAWVAAGVLAGILFLAIFGYAVAPDDPRATNLAASAQGPSGAHPFGTDEVGRDLLSRTLAGAQTAVLGPLAVALFVVPVATLLGLVAGFRGGRVDAVISRATDLLYALPPLLVAIIVVGTLSGGYALAILLIALLSLPDNVRTIRAAALEQRALPYIEAARTLGMSQRAIMVRHILPNLVPVMVSIGFVRFTYAFVDLTTLNFLGLGVSADTPDWGRMLAESRILVFENAWAAVAPLVLIVLTTVSANLLGEAVHDHYAEAERAR